MIILTNDDGIDAPGLAALERAMAGEDLMTVAPLQPMSECSHRVTTSKGLPIHQLAERRFAVDGTPADCVRAALLHLLPQVGVEMDSPELRVYSGINSGGNLGADIYISGTVAAVREATFFGVKAIAFSQYRRAEPDAARWTRATQLARQAIEVVEAQPLGEGEFWNVNFPWVDLGNSEMPPLVFCERSRRPLPVKYEVIEGGIHYRKGLYHLREYEPGSDIDHCFNGRIAVSRVAI